MRNTTALAIVLALNNAFTTPGQIIGVYIYRAEDAPTYRFGHGINAMFLIIGALLSFGLSFYYNRLNRNLTSPNTAKYVT